MLLQVASPVQVFKPEVKGITPLRAMPSFARALLSSACADEYSWV